MAFAATHPSSQGPLILPLLKFSYATVPNDSIAPIPWTHLSSCNGLFAIFEILRTQNIDGSIQEKQKFKVMRDSEIMETIDLQVLAVEAHRAIATAQNLSSHVHSLGVAIIVKKPLIAMRYPCPDGQIRRFQIRLASDEGFYEAMRSLANANVPTAEAGTFQVQRPRTSPHTTTFDVSGIGNTASATSGFENTSKANLFNKTNTLSSEGMTNTKIQELPAPLYHPSEPVSRPLSQREGMSSVTRLADNIASVADKNKSTITSVYQLRSLTAAKNPENNPQCATRSDLGLPSANSTSEHQTIPAPNATSQSIGVSTKKSRSSTPKAFPDEKGCKTATTRAKQKKPAASSVSVGIGSKRARTITHCRKNETKQKQVSKILSVEELMRQVEESCAEEPQKSAIDTQKLLERVEEVRVLRSSAKRMTSDQHQPEAENKCSDTARKSLAEQVSTSAKANKLGKASAQRRDDPKKIAQDEVADAMDIHIPAESITSATEEQQQLKAPTAKGGKSTFYSDYRLLLADPSFANSTDFLKSWSDLPQEQQEAAIESWLCQQFKNQDFIKLCEVIERNWKRILVYP